MNAADRRSLTRILGTITVGLTILLIALWLGAGRGSQWHDTATAPLLPRDGFVSTAPVVIPLHRYQSIWQQPLFNPTRTRDPLTAGAGDVSGDLQLTGVIMLPGLNMALLHDQTLGKDYRAIEGHSTPGVPVLLELHPQSAVVEASGLRLHLQLVPGPAPGPEDTKLAEASPTPDGVRRAPSNHDSADAPQMVLRRAGPFPQQVEKFRPATGSAATRTHTHVVHREVDSRSGGNPSQPDPDVD